MRICIANLSTQAEGDIGYTYAEFNRFQLDSSSPQPS